MAGSKDKRYNPVAPKVIQGVRGGYYIDPVETQSGKRKYFVSFRGAGMRAGTYDEVGVAGTISAAKDMVKKHMKKLAKVNPVTYTPGHPEVSKAGTRYLKAVSTGADPVTTFRKEYDKVYKYISHSDFLKMISKLTPKKPVGSTPAYIGGATRGVNPPYTQTITYGTRKSASIPGDWYPVVNGKPLYKSVRRSVQAAENEAKRAAQAAAEGLKESGYRVEVKKTIKENSPRTNKVQRSNPLNSTIGEYWDALSLIERENICNRVGWTTQQAKHTDQGWVGGHITPMGKRIAKTPWTKLTDSGREVLSRNYEQIVGWVMENPPWYHHKTITGTPGKRQLSVSDTPTRHSSVITEIIKKGRQQVVINNQNTGGIFESRLYVNNGETATPTSARHKTLQGAVNWANKTLGVHVTRTRVQGSGISKRPLRVVHGNPPVGATKIYDNITAIEARKGRNSMWPGEDFRHDFKTTKGKASVYGLPDGSLLIKGNKRLWKKFNYPQGASK